MIERNRIHLLRVTQLLLAVTILTAAGVGLGAEPRFPPPDFETGYKPPSTLTPQPVDPTWYVIDVVVLAVFLVAAALIALRFRRRWLMLVLAAGALGYFGFFRKGCVCAVGSLQNVALALGGSGYTIPLVVIAFFVLPLVAALFWGRVFCGAVCPLGAIQELVALRPVRLPRWLSSSLGLLRYVYLALAVVLASTGAAFLICRYDPFVALFRLSGPIHKLIGAACLLLVGVFVSRPYCRFVCPYGVLLGWASRLSWKRLTITPDECIQCRLCEDACPNDAIDKANAQAPPQGRLHGRRLLVALLVALPILTVAGGYLGRLAGPAMSRLHPQVDLARQIADEQAAGKTENFTDPSKAYRNTGRTMASLHETAASLKSRFVIACMLAGGFLGAVIGLKLISLSVRRRRTDYEANRSACLVCARCFSRCPIELKRRSSGVGGSET